MSRSRGCCSGSARSGRAAGVFVGAVVSAFWFVSALAFAAGPPVPFSASGPILTIDTGEVKPAGQSGRFIVRDRHVTGILAGSIGGATGVPFVMTYDFNVPIATQSGRVHARLIAGVYEANVEMASSIGLTPVPCDTPDGATCIATPGENFVPGLLLNGNMNFLSAPPAMAPWLVG